MMRLSLAPLLSALLALGGCASVAPPSSVSSTVASKAAASACSDGNSTIDADFEGGAFAQCETVGKDHYRLLVIPEDDQVTNCSAWYAFRLKSAASRNVTVDLDYSKCGHRYWPKIRQPGEDSWQVLPESAVTITGDVDGGDSVASASLRLDLGAGDTFVAGEELVLSPDYARWLDGLPLPKGSVRETIGTSVEGRPIEMLSFGDDLSKGEQVVLIGRQHPPEVSGALAMFAFVERLLEDDDLAQRYRARFDTRATPLMNPDGVADGHWRHNEWMTDLNRDWGPFRQPETRLMRDVMEKLDDDPQRELVLFLDFHSTQKDVVYTLPPEQVTDPAGFMADFLKTYAAKLPGYKVREQAGHNADSPVSKAWVYERFGVPTATYEIGDETDRALIRKLGRAAAEAMMEELLKTPR